MTVIVGVGAKVAVGVGANVAVGTGSVCSAAAFPPQAVKIRTNVMSPNTTNIDRFLFLIPLSHSFGVLCGCAFTPACRFRFPLGPTLGLGAVCAIR